MRKTFVYSDAQVDLSSKHVAQMSLSQVLPKEMIS